MKLHPKIQALKLRSKPYNSSPIISENLYPEFNKEIRAKRELKDNQNAFYFCIWGVRDSYGTGWTKGCFAKSIRERGPQSAANQKIVACWQHDITDPIGRPIEMIEDKRGCYVVVEWDDPEAVPNAKRAMSQIRSGTINGYSFGFDYVWDKMEYDEASDTIWVMEADLYEISPVTFASIQETFTVRNREDYDSRKMILDEETQDFIKTLPRSKQLELRQLLTRHITLSKVEPETLSIEEPKEGMLNIGEYKINLNAF